MYCIYVALTYIRLLLVQGSFVDEQHNIILSNTR